MATEILRPAGDGDETSIHTGYPDSSNHYANVDEETPDDASSFNTNDNIVSYQRDLYTLPASSGFGPINFIKIYFRCRAQATDMAYGKPSLKSDNTVTDGTEVSLDNTQWVTYSQQWSTNPADGEAWEWADIDALQIGVSLKKITGNAYCTQVYVEVDYSPIYDETGHEVTIVAEIGSSDVQTMNEVGKEQTVLAAVDEVDTQDMIETGKEQTVLAVVSGDVAYGHNELDLEQVIKAVIGSSDIQTMDETGKEQVILAAIDEADIQTMQELGITQVILVVTGESETQAMIETGKLQEIKAVVGESESLTLDETGKEVVITVDIGESDSQAMLEALGQVILAVVGKREGRLLVTRRLRDSVREPDTERVLSPERVQESEIVQ